MTSHNRNIVLDTQTAHEGCITAVAYLAGFAALITFQFYVTDKKFSMIATPVFLTVALLAYLGRRATNEYHLLDADQKKLLFVSKFLGNVREMSPVCTFAEIREVLLTEGTVTRNKHAYPAWALDLVRTDGTTVRVMDMTADAEAEAQAKKSEIESLLQL